MKINPANRTDSDADATTETDELTARADGAGAKVIDESSAAEEPSTSDDGGVDTADTPAEPSTAEADGVEPDEAPEESTTSDEDGVDTEGESDRDASALEGAEPLKIALPDGSESVSEAILSHRQMLRNPSDHDLVSAAEVEDVREAVETLSDEVSEDLRGEMETLETSVDEMADRLDRQQEQIRELRDTVASLAEILGASVDFQSLDED